MGPCEKGCWSAAWIPTVFEPSTGAPVSESRISIWPVGLFMHVLSVVVAP